MNELTTTQQTILEASINHLNGSIHPLPANLKGEAARKVIKSLLKKGLIEEDGPETWRITDAAFQAIGLKPPQVETTADSQVENDSTTHDDPELEEDLAMVEQAMNEMAKAFEDKPADDPVADEPTTPEQRAAEDEPTTAEQQAMDDEPTTAEEDEEPTPSNLQIIIGVAQSFGVESETFANVFNGMLGRAFQHGQESMAKPAKARRQPDSPRQPRTDSKQARVIALMQRPEGATLAQIAEATGWQGHTIRSFISTAKKKGMEIATNHVRMVGPNKQGAPGSTTTYFVN